jgi:hypothetical protein
MRTSKKMRFVNVELSQIGSSCLPALYLSTAVPNMIRPTSFSKRSRKL